MKDFWTRVALGAAAIVCLGASHATTIDFENVDASGAPFAPVLTDLDMMTQAGFTFGVYDPHNPSTTPDGAIVGALANGSDPGSCLDSLCPLGNATNHLDVLNDGVMFIGHGGDQMSLASFDATFLAPANVPVASPDAAFLAVEADRANGSYAVGIFALAAPSNGNTSFASYLASNAQIIGGSGTLTSGDVTGLYAYAYYCSPATGNCTFGTSNLGQFAIDNISITAITSVPEPASWLLLAAGLGALGAASRRRRSA